MRKVSLVRIEGDEAAHACMRDNMPLLQNGQHLLFFMLSVFKLRTSIAESNLQNTDRSSVLCVFQNTFPLLNKGFLFLIRNILITCNI